MVLPSIFRSFAFLLALCAVLVAGRSALAAEAVESGDSASSKNAASTKHQPFPWSVGARVFYLPAAGVAGLGAGLDLALSVLPNVAVGLQYLAFMVDHGADPHYCARCIRGGSSAFAFAEGRYWPQGWATPYARLGAGWSHLNGQRVEYDEGYTEVDVSLLAEAGLELHYRWVSCRALAFDHVILKTELDGDPLIGGGVQLGARF